MKVNTSATACIFEADEVKQELIVDALEFFVDKLKTTGASVSALYPGDPFALPFSMFLSDKLSVPIKTEKFLDREEQTLVVFSYLSEDITKDYIANKLAVFRKRFPRSPSLLVAAPKVVNLVDFQLIKAPFGKLNSYRFTVEARRNFFYPLEGEFTHFTSELWEISRQEIRSFEKAKRIRDNARKFLREDFAELRLLDSDVEISIWERFFKGILVQPEFPVNDEENAFSFKVEKLIQVADKELNSAVTSLLEYIAQGFEYKFPTHLAYSNLEVLDRDGVTLIPRVVEEMNGADIRLEVVIRSKNLQKDYREFITILKDTLGTLFTEIFEKEAFRPALESVVEKEIGKARVYVNWFLDREMVNTLFSKINKKWLLARLLHRKQLKLRLKELFKFIDEFYFTPENYETLFSLIEFLWKKNSVLVKVHGEEIRNAFDRKNLWPLVGVYGLKHVNSKSETLKSLVKFLLFLKGCESIHQFLATQDTYWCPVKTKRIYRPNWEKVIRNGERVVLKPEPLNPDSPVTLVVQSEDGRFLGTVPEPIAHYVSIKLFTGREIKCRKLYLDKDLFSDSSYWVEIKCL